MPNQPPSRMPCESVAGQPIYYLGSPFQHALAPSLVPKFANTTLVPNPAGGADIPPFERWTPDPSGGGSCETHHCVTDPGAAPCSAWKVPFTDNVFTDTGDFVDMAVTRKRGFKNVMARRYWNGRFGYTYRNGDDTWQACGDATTRVSWRGVQAAAARTKYLKIVASSTWKSIQYNFAEVLTEDTSLAASVTEEIDSATGVLNPTAMTLSPNELLDNSPMSAGSNDALIALQKAFWTWSEVVNLMTGFTTSFPGAVATYGASSATLTNPTNSQVLEQLDWDVSTGTFNRTIYNVSTGFFDVIGSEQVALTETTFAYTYYKSLLPPNPSFTPVHQSRLDITVNATLSVANTDATVYADVTDTLLATWQLNDDKQYPWRGDLKVALAPLVSRDEIPTFAFDAIGFYVQDYGAPVVDSDGFTLGDPGWHINTGATLSPNPLTGTYRTARGYGPYATGTVIDQQIAGFNHTDAAITCTVIGGSFPSGITMTSDGHITGTIGDDGTWGVTIEVTCGVAAYTGAILGAPKPAGYIDYFDFRFQHWLGCCYHPPAEPELSVWSWYQQGWGMWVSAFNTANGCGLPLNSTQWTNVFQSVNKPIGAFLFYNDKRIDYCGTACPSDNCGTLDADALWGCKYAEILETWPSQNFAMPAGDAKFWFDENQVYCATNLSGSGAGSTWSLIDPRTSAAPADGTIDLTKLWGGPVVGGFYSLTSYSAGVVTLNAKVWDLPSNWISKSHVTAVAPDTGDPIADEDFCFGMLRWPTQPALLGRIAVTTTGPGTTFTYASQPAFGLLTATHQEQIDLYDASMTVIATNVTATRISDTQFSIVSGQPTAVWAQIHGSAKWYVNDTSAKGDFTVLDWLADLRTKGEYNRLTSTLDCSSAQVTRPTANAGGGPATAPFAAFHQVQCCLPFQPCAPKVVCISPNGETFPNGITYDFPEDFVCDEDYGSKWWKLPQQAMTDLFWQKPHRPCNIEPCAKWAEDDGLCNTDSPGVCPPTEEAGAPQYFFGLRPQVEARLTVPSSSDSCNTAYGPDQTEAGPALPDGIQIGWLSPVNYEDGEIALPPEPSGVSDPGVANGAATPWILHENICDHQAGCRFGYDLKGC